ncbi:unnamed protein product [Orchesella dallaii]|uniref:Uncharacterized protein n=1 Tax=Orchesella dallaii TaxID=48710 RepID=A0ABP1RXY3_9HEXA
MVKTESFLTKRRNEKISAYQKLGRHVCCKNDELGAGDLLDLDESYDQSLVKECFVDLTMLNRNAVNLEGGYYSKYFRTIDCLLCFKNVHTAPPDAVPSVNLICSHIRECGAPPETFEELQVNILLAIKTMGGLKGPMFEKLRLALEWLLSKTGIELIQEYELAQEVSQQLSEAIQMEDAATQTTFASSPQKRQTETVSRLAVLQPHVDPDQVPRLTASNMVWIFVMLLFGIYMVQV